MSISPIYQTIFNNTGAATVIIEADTTISLANSEFAKLSGFSKEEIEGKLSWTDFVHSDDLERMQEYHVARRENPASAPRNYEFRVRDRYGNVRQVVITIALIPDTSQSVASLVDITENVKVRKILERRLQFEKIISRISRKFINLPKEEIDAGVVDALKAIAEFIQADRSYTFLIEADGVHISNTHEWCAPGVVSQKDVLQHQSITDVPWTFQQLLENKNIYIPTIDALPDEAAYEKKLLEEQKIESLAIVPLYYRNTLWGFLGLDAVSAVQDWDDDDFIMLRTVGDTIINSLERKRFEEEIKRSEKRYRDFVDFLPQVVFEAELDGTITFANRYAYELFGYTKEDYRKGVSVYAMIDKSEWERAEKNVGKVCQGATTVGNEYTGITKAGKKFPILIYSAPVFEGAVIKGIRGIIIDIRVRKRLEEQLQQSQKMEAIGRLAGGIAHDFNNMLTSIMGFASVLQLNPKICTECREAVESIVDVAKSGANLTRQLLSFSRKDIITPTSLSVNAVTEKAVKMLQRLLRDGIVIDTDLNEHIWRIKADPGQIEQVVMNLVLNSQDALPNGGKIMIRTKNMVKEEVHRLNLQGLSFFDYVVLEVIDNGRGMSEDIKDKVFEPFFTTKGDGSGTGLGLSTVYGIAKQHGGSINIVSQPDKGTTIAVYFPRLHAEKAETTREPRSKLTGVQGKKNILVVEDDKNVRGIIVRLLKAQGYEAFEVGNGESALALLRQHDDIHLVVTDIVMPGMSGRELAEDLSREYPELPVLLMSGYSDDASLRKDLESERWDFLQKPFTADQLEDKIINLLKQLQRGAYPENHV